MDSKHADSEYSYLHAALDEWIKDMEKHDPNIEDGESISIMFSGGRVAHDKDDKPLYSVSIETRRVQNPF